jgi:ESCRT-II complex subunit VPS25
MATATPSPVPSGLAGPTYMPPTTAPPNPSTSAFSFPTYTTFPPFYTLQPNLTTRARQLTLWSQFILSYAAHNRFYRLSISSPPADLFANPAIHRALSEPDIRAVLDHMALPANGARVEWISAGARGERAASCWIYWRTLAEWADMIYGWVDETGQKGSVLTVYELREGEAVGSKEWVGMEEEMLKKVLGVLVKKGRAQVFGQDEGAGVKFF